MGRRLKLHPGVFYRLYDEFVVLFHTGTRRVFTFNRTSADIFDCFRDFRDMDSAIGMLETVYTVEDQKDFADSIRAFVEDAVSKEILRAEYKQSENKGDLERRVSDSFSGTDQIYSATIELTYRCNEKCRHCFIVDEGKIELTTEKVKAVLDELADLGVCNVVFTGGEVFMRKDAFDILTHAYRKGFVVDIFTNGVLLNAEACVRLKALWPRCVHFSLYSHIPEKHDGITLIKGSFERTLASVKTCTLIGIPVNIKCSIFKETLDDIPGLIALAESVGASIELSKNIIPRKDGSLAGTALKITSDQDYRRVSALIGDLIDGVDVLDARCDTRGKICGAGEHSISINPYGEVYPCNTLPLIVGDVRTQSVREIWQESAQLKWWRDHNYRDKLVGCGDCMLANDCVFCPGEAMMRTGDPVRMYEDACAATRLATIGAEGRG